MSPVPFEPESPLEEALLRAAEENDRAGFLRELARSDVWVPAPPPDGEEEGFALPLWAHGEMRFVPVFTSESRFRDLAPGHGGWARLRVGELTARMDPDALIGVNPGGALGLLLLAQDVRA